MKIKRTDTQKETPSGKKPLNSFFTIATIIVFLIILLFFIWHQKSLNSLTDVQDFNKRTLPDISVSTPPPPNKTHTKTTFLADARTSDQTGKEHTKTNNELIRQPSRENATDHININTLPKINETGTSTVSRVFNQSTGIVSSTSKSDDSRYTDKSGIISKTCSESTDIIRRFYRHLDTQEYMKPYGLKVSSEKHFTHLIQSLIDNPPVVSGETNDLFTILQNTAHFYRIIGKDNILILKGILDREKDQFENVLKHFYTIFQTPSCPGNSFNLRVTETSLYDYAGFFLNTMGGRLYLFRRDSMSRIVVSYYSILLVDQANKEARNKYGIEIKTSIDQVIADMEASSRQFKLEQVYLDNLYTLKEQYQ